MSSICLLFNRPKKREATKKSSIRLCVLLIDSLSHGRFYKSNGGSYATFKISSAALNAKFNLDRCNFKSDHSFQVNIFLLITNDVYATSVLPKSMDLTKLLLLYSFDLFRAKKKF